MYEDCIYYKGETENPFDATIDFPRISLIHTNAKALWWTVEKECFERFPDWDNNTRMDCYFNKVMDDSSINKKAAIESYNTGKEL